MLSYYYLEKMQEESLEYDDWVMGGFLGITPSSWLREMGFFRQLDDYYLPEMARVRHKIGVEIHASTESALNYLTIGGYDTSIVEHDSLITWLPIYCS